MKKEDIIEISLHDGSLSMSGERKSENKRKGVPSLSMERFPWRRSENSEPPNYGELG